MARNRHNVTLLGGWDGQASPPDLDGVAVRLFRARQLIPATRFSGLISPGLSRYLISHSKAYDLVHIHLGRDLVTLNAALIAKARRLPYVVQTHGMITPDTRMKARLLDSIATRRTLLGADRVFYLTQNEQTALNDVAGQKLWLEYLRNGITIDNAETSEGHNSSSTVKTVLFCARLHPRKRVLAFADMAAALVRRGVDANFVVAGPDDGDLSALRTRASRSDLKGRLSYEGALSPDVVSNRLRQATVYVLPSINEPFPMTVLEAMAVGTPAVLTDTCHIGAELNEQGAALITDGSPERLADAVQRLLTDDLAYQSVRSNAFELLKANYSIDAVATQLDSTYRDVLSNCERTV